MTRRRFSERDVLRTLLHQGVKILSRSGEPVTLENVHLVEREHLHELALGGADEPSNCRYSLKADHAAVTNGTKATTAGSSKNRIAKATHDNRTEKFVVNKRPPGEPRQRSRWGSRKLQGRGFQPGRRGFRSVPA